MIVPFESYLQAVSYTDVGLVRHNNEDRVLCLPKHGFYAIADGMGGEAFGEVASEYLLEGLREGFGEEAMDQSPGDRKYTIQQKIHEANLKIRAYIRKKGVSNMGCTLVGLLLDSWEPAWAKICYLGDSRCYCFYNGELQQLTTDHTLEELERSCGRKAGQSVRPGVLTRAVGISDFIHPEWRELELHPNDIFLLCSDGVSSVVEKKVLESCFVGTEDPNEIVRRIRETVLAAGARDNFSMICAKVAPELPLAIIPSKEEQEESDYLEKITENRVDYASE